jgi:trimeric autotransporter adhesin
MLTKHHCKSFIVGVALFLGVILTTAATATTVTVQVAPGGDLSFSPGSVSIQPGDTVTWVWASAGMLHSVTSGVNCASDGRFNSGLHGFPFTFSFTFPNAGTFPYHCIPHCDDGMSGIVTVVSASPTPTPPPGPVVTTNPATNVASFSATLNGSVNPHGATTTVYFQYGPTTNYGSTTPMQTQTGNTVRTISANITGLSASHLYHFRIVAHNASGTSFGSDKTFTTLSPTGPPVVPPSPATLIASFSATLNGTVDPHGLTTSVHFQYGTTTSYGLTTAPQSQSGNTYRSVSANISSLSASTVYHFRIVATNSAGTTFGGDRTFTTLSPTGPPVATTNPATLIASFSATLNALLDPHGLTTSVHFQYGPTTGYGFTTAPQSQSGNTYRNVSANISSLTASTTYHFRVVVSNSAGTSMGSDKTLSTLTATGPPVVSTSPATNLTTSSATLNGSLDPHGLTTTVSFQYGTTTSYGHTTSMQTQTGNTYRNIAANISGLTTHTTYHFRIVATNSSSTKMGGDIRFTTP